MPGGPALSLEGGERALKTWTLGRLSRSTPKLDRKRHQYVTRALVLFFYAWTHGLVGRPIGRKSEKEKRRKK